jgi:hypothetical protein
MFTPVLGTLVFQDVFNTISFTAMRTIQMFNVLGLIDLPFAFA